MQVTKSKNNNKTFVEKTINIIFMYLLAPVIEQN